MVALDYQSLCENLGHAEKRKKCPDCLECQQCIKSRCQLCRQGGHSTKASELGPFITHGEYMAWKEKKKLIKTIG